MTVAKVRSLLIELGFDVKNLKQAQEVEDAVENIVSGMERLTSVAKQVAGTIIGVATALTVVEKSIAGNAAEMQRTADALGVHVESLQQLSFAYGKLKIDHAEMIDSFQKLSDRVEKASAGSKEYNRVFGLLNLKATELKKLDMADMYRTTLKAVAALEDPQKRLAALTGVFGETLARKLAPALANNGDLLRKYMKLATEAGAIMSKDQVQALAALDFAFAQMQVTFTAIRNEIAVSLAPLFERMVGRVWQLYKANRELVKVRVAEAVDRISTSMEQLWGMAKQVNSVVERMGGWFRIAELAMLAVAGVMTAKVGNALTLIAGGFKALYGAIAAVGARFVLLFGVIILAVLVLASAFDELAASERGADTVLEGLRKNYDKLHPVLKALYALLDTARVAWLLMADAVESIIIPSLKKLRPILGLIVTGILLLGVILMAAITAIVLIGAAIVWLVAEFWSWVVMLGKLLWNLGQVTGNLVELVSNGLDPASEAAKELYENLADVVAALGEVESINWIAKKFGVDLQAHGAEITQPGVMRQRVNTNLTSAFGSPKAALSTLGRGPAATNNNQQVRVEQRNEFIIQGSMDESTGKRVAQQAGDASQRLANSINNAARGGNR